MMLNNDKEAILNKGAERVRESNVNVVKSCNSNSGDVISSNQTSIMGMMISNDSPRLSENTCNQLFINSNHIPMPIANTDNALVKFTKNLFGNTPFDEVVLLIDKNKEWILEALGTSIYSFSRSINIKCFSLPDASKKTVANAFFRVPQIVSVNVFATSSEWNAWVDLVSQLAESRLIDVKLVECEPGFRKVCNEHGTVLVLLSGFR